MTAARKAKEAQAMMAVMASLICIQPSEPYTTSLIELLDNDGRHVACQVGGRSGTSQPSPVATIVSVAMSPKALLRDAEPRMKHRAWTSREDHAA